MPRDATYAIYEPKSEDEKNLHDAWVEYNALLDEKRNLDKVKDRALKKAFYTPLVFASKLLKKAFNYTIGLKWFIRITRININKNYSMLLSIRVPKLDVTIPDPNSYNNKMIQFSSKKYKARVWVAPFIALNWIASTIGQLLGLAIGLLFALSAYAITRVNYFFKKIRLSNDITHSFKKTCNLTKQILGVDFESNTDNLWNHLHQHAEKKLLNDMISAFISAVDDYSTLPFLEEDQFKSHNQPTESCNENKAANKSNILNADKYYRYLYAIIAFKNKNARFPIPILLESSLGEMIDLIRKDGRGQEIFQKIEGIIFSNIEEYCTTHNYTTEANAFGILKEYTHYKMALHFSACGEMNKAFDLFSNISIDSPDYFDAMMACGTILKVEKRYNEALEYFCRARQSEERTMAGIDRMRQRDSEALFEIAFTEWVLEEESMQHNEDIPSYLSESKRNPTKMEIANQPKFVASNINLTDCKATFLASNPYGWRHPSQMNFGNKNSINKSNLPYCLQPNLHRKK